MIEQFQPDTREAWLALRRDDVTASTIGALLGVHPYVTPFELYSEKVKADVGEGEENTAMLRGQLLESVAIEMLRRTHPGWRLTANAMPGGVYYRDPELHLGATPDCFAVDEHGRRGVIQVKSVEPSIFRRDWLDDNIIVPPLWAAAQVIVEAHLAEAEFAALAPIRIGYGIEVNLVEVPLHPELLERIKREVQKFWQLVANLTPPPMDYNRDGQLLASLYREEDGSSISLAHDNEFVDAVVARQEAKDHIKIHEETVKRCDALIRDRMGAAAVATTSGHIVTAKTQRRAGYTVRDAVFRPIKVKDLRGSRHG